VWMERQLLLQSGKLSQSWSALSGGERQRAIIACGVLVTCPQRVMRLQEAQDERGEGNGESIGSRLDAFAQESFRATDDTGAAPSANSHNPTRNENLPTSYAVLLLDEPTAACDAQACAAVERLLMEIGVACVVVTYDERQAARLATTRVILTDG